MKDKRDIDKVKKGDFCKRNTSTAPRRVTLSLWWRRRYGFILAYRVFQGPVDKQLGILWAPRSGSRRSTWMAAGIRLLYEWTRVFGRVCLWLWWSASSLKVTFCLHTCCYSLLSTLMMTSASGSPVQRWMRTWGTLLPKTSPPPFVCLSFSCLTDLRLSVSVWPGIKLYITSEWCDRDDQDASECRGVFFLFVCFICFC